MLALGLLIASKVLTVQVPFFFKHAVDVLAADPSGATALPFWSGAIGSASDVTPTLLMLGPSAALLGYGAARAGAALCGELRSVVFARVAQSVVRGVAREVRCLFESGAGGSIKCGCGVGVFWGVGGERLGMTSVIVLPTQASTLRLPVCLNGMPLNNLSC